MTIWGKRDLERFGAQFSQPMPSTIEFSWSERGGYRNRLRMTECNRGEFNIAEPGLGGTFNLSYQYLTPAIPLRGTGIETLRTLVLDPQHGLRKYTHHADPVMVDLLISMINVSRRTLLGRA